MKSIDKRHVFACLLCIVLIVFSAAPVFAVSYTTEFFHTTLDVQENSSMHVTEEIYVTFSSPGHGIYRYIPNYDTKAYFMHDGELVSAEMPYEIKNVRCEGQEIDKESSGGSLVVRIGSADVTVTGMQKYVLEYDIVMYVDGIDYLDQLYWNVVPAYWDTDIDFAAFTVNMPKPFDGDAVDVITGPVGTGDTTRASWDFYEDDWSLAGHVDDLSRGEGITVRITLPEGYWVGAKNNAAQWRIAEGIIAALTVFVMGLFVVKGKDPKPVKTVEFYPPDDLSPAEIGYIYDNKIDDRDMTSLVMWFASKGYLRVHAEESRGILKKDKVHIELEKLRDIPSGAPAYQRTFFNALFEKSFVADMDALAKSTDFADSYVAAKDSLRTRYGDKTKRRLQEGYQYVGMGCLSGVLIMAVVVLSLFFLMSRGGQVEHLLLVALIAGAIVLICTIFMTRPTEYRTRMLGRIHGFREFIKLAELDRIQKLVEQDPDYFYNILPYAYIFNLTDKWASHFDRLAVSQPDWYDGPPAYIMTPSVFCSAMDNGVRSNLTQSVIHTTSSSDFSGGGSFSSGGGGFSGGGGGGGGGGGW